MDKQSSSEAVLNGWSINALATASGIPYTTLHRKLGSLADLTMGEALKIAEAQGRNPAELIRIVSALVADSERPAA